MLATAAAQASDMLELRDRDGPLRPQSAGQGGLNAMEGVVLQVRSSGAM